MTSYNLFFLNNTSNIEKNSEKNNEKLVKHIKIIKKNCLK